MIYILHTCFGGWDLYDLPEVHMFAGLDLNLCDLHDLHISCFAGCGICVI